MSKRCDTCGKVQNLTMCEECLDKIYEEFEEHPERFIENEWGFTRKKDNEETEN